MGVLHLKILAALQTKFSGGEQMKKTTRTLKESFSAYLLHAVENTIRTYCKKENRILSREVLAEKVLSETRTVTQQPFDSTDILECEYIGIVETEKFLQQITDSHLIKAICSLSPIGKEVMCLRILYEKSFEQIGEIEGITSKKAENTYYNSIYSKNFKISGLYIF